MFLEVFELKGFVGPPLEAHANFVILALQTFRGLVPEDLATAPRHATHARIKSELHVLLCLFIGKVGVREIQGWRATE